MAISRRDFLLTGGALAATALAPGRLLAALKDSSRRAHAAAPGAAPPTWPEVRALFALAPNWTHMSSFFFVSHPRPVRDAIEHYRRALDENPLPCIEHSLFLSETENVQLEVCRAAAAYVGGGPEEIALVPNTTTGLALVYAGLPLRPGDEILTTTHDHYSHHESIRLAAERARASVRKVALYDRAAEASRDEILARVRRAVRPRTRVLGLTWVHSSTGVRLPVRAIADVVAEINRGRAPAGRLLLVVDGVHGFGCVDESAADLGCDFFCAGTHKWIFAPRGTGLVWAPAANWRMMQPVIPDFSSLPHWMSWMRGEPAPPVDAAMMSPGGFQAYEHQWGMRAAFELHRRMGRARVAARIRELNDRCRAGLANISGVTLHTPRDPELSAGILCFDVKDRSAGDVAKQLVERRIVASASPYAVSHARLAPSLVNDAADVDRALGAVAAIARG